MMRGDEIEALWVAEVHPKGGFAVHPLGEVLERNRRMMAAPGWDGTDSWVAIGVAGTMEGAREFGREFRRMKGQWVAGIKETETQ
jgi:hypothetical protein